MAAATSAVKSFRVVVTPEVRDFFTSAIINGQGGFQRLVRMLADRLAADKSLHLSPEEFTRIVRYATEYGDGGYQLRLRKIVTSWVAQNLSSFTED